jgi:hypothetical protein
MHRKGNTNSGASFLGPSLQLSHVPVLLQQSTLAYSVEAQAVLVRCELVQEIQSNFHHVHPQEFR